MCCHLSKTRIDCVMRRSLHLVASAATIACHAVVFHAAMLVLGRTETRRGTVVLFGIDLVRICGGQRREGGG